jgi:hypothetical protein
VIGMFGRHVSGQLARYVDNQLTAAEVRAVEAHLVSCSRCRADHDEIRFAAGLIRQLKVMTPPAAVWHDISRQLDAAPALRPWLAGWGPRSMAAAAAALLVAMAGAIWLARPPSEGAWEVATSSSVVPSRMAEGDWVETDDGSRARITIGTIGEVVVEPSTRVRLGASLPDSYRLALARGTLSARIAAPPRLFFVETPASTVVDLGCAYTVQVDEAGTGDLRVTEGWASLEWQGRESLVPAGARCRIRSGVGPGTPVFEDASPALQQAVADFDFGGSGAAPLRTILAEARVRDTLTLWHLLSRVPEADRSRIYDRMVELTPLPDGVSRDGALALDAAMLRRWREELAWTW